MTQTQEHRQPRPRLGAGMACWLVCWLVIGVGWVALTGLAATGYHADLTGNGPWATIPESGTLQVSGTGTAKTISCHNGYLSVSGERNTITVTGHCTSVGVAGKGNRVTVDSTDAVSTSGTGNLVSYHWGSPNIVNAGRTNTVQQG